MSEYRSLTTPVSRGQREEASRSWALAMAYVPWQQWNRTYELKKAMCAGTIFPELDKRFLGKRGECG